jgi:hypothetical protein
MELARADLGPVHLPARRLRLVAEFEDACEVCEEVNTPVHRVIRRPPVQTFAEEQASGIRFPSTLTRSHSG